MRISVEIDYSRVEEVQVTEKRKGYDLYLVEDGQEFSVNFKTPEEMRELANRLREKSIEFEHSGEARRKRLAGAFRERSGLA